MKMLEEVWCVNVTTITVQKCWKHIGMISSGILTLGSTDTLLLIVSQNVELANL